MRPAYVVLLVALTIPVPAATARGSDEAPAGSRVVSSRTSEGRPSIFIGATRRAYLGIETVELSPGLRRHYGAPVDRGVMISRIAEGTPADRAGLRVGDLVLSVQGRPVTSAWELKASMSRHRGGDRVRIDVVRGGERLEIGVTLDEHEARIADLAPFVGRDREGRIVLLDPERTQRLVHRLHHSGGSLPPPDELERALEAAVRALRSEELPAKVHDEIAVRRRLETRIRELEERLRRVERELANRSDGAKED